MSANFTVYRRGVAAFTIESRVQGGVRKATSAKYGCRLMEDDSVSLTVLSSVRLDFRLRDYIMYEGRPYMLNQMPEVSMDTSKLYTYNVRFEGAMYELGRVAFLLDNAFGYDYCGTLADFGRLIVRNMNRVNRFVEWEEHETDPDEPTTRCGRQSGVSPDGKVIWGNLNGDAPVITQSSRVNNLFKSWIETATENPSPNSSPIGTSRATASTPPVVKLVHEWKIDFPKRTATPADYPAPVYYEPDSIPDSNIHWPDPNNQAEAQYIAEEDFMATVVNPQLGIVPIPGGDGLLPYYYYEKTFVAEAYSQQPLTQIVPSGTPTHVGEKCVKQRGYGYTIRVRKFHYENGVKVYDDDNCYASTAQHPVTFTATGTSGTTWQMHNVTPQSGAATGDDFETAENLLSYDSHSCLAVLNDICTQWGGWEWYIDSEECKAYKGEMLVNATIHFRQKDQNATGVTHSMGFGRKGGLSAIRCRYSDDTNIPSKVYFYGGTQNLPQYYRNTRLCLPNAEKSGSYIDLTNVQGSLPAATTNRTCEEVKVFDEIYPASEPFEIGAGWGVSIATENTTNKHYLQLTIPEAEFFDITAKWLMGERPSFPQRALTDSDINDYPDYFEWLKWKGETDEYDPSTYSSPQRERYIFYYVHEHVSKYMTGGDTPMFVFQTGDIAGYSLALHSFSKQTIRGGEYWVVLLECADGDNSEVATSQDESPKYVPNATVYPVAGDKFIIDGINMPVSYTYCKDGSANDRSAECRLWKAAMDYVGSLSEKLGYEIEVSRDYAVKRHFAPSVRDSVCFDNVLSDGSAVSKRITELELDLVDGYTYKIVISSGAVAGKARGLRNLISSVTKTNTR